jgi:hypothetical protein
MEQNCSSEGIQKDRSPWKLRHITFLDAVTVDNLQNECADMNIVLAVRYRNLQKLVTSTFI